MIQNKRYVWTTLLGIAMIAVVGLLLWNDRPSEQSTVPADMAKAEVGSMATSAIDPSLVETDPAIIAEKLKEVTTYRNEEFEFEFQHPKYRSLPNGTLKEIEEYKMNSGLESIPLELSWSDLEATLHIVKKPFDFSTLHGYIDERYEELEIMAEQGEPVYPCKERNSQTIKVGTQQAFLEECSFQGRHEVTIYIETSDYIYHIYGPGANSQEPEAPQSRQFIQTLIETWKFFEEE